MFSPFTYSVIKWIFIVLDFLLAAYFVWLLKKTRPFWEQPRLYYPWEKKRLLQELEENKNERGEDQAH